MSNDLPIPVKFFAANLSPRFSLFKTVFAYLPSITYCLISFFDLRHCLRINAKIIYQNMPIYLFIKIYCKTILTFN